MFKKISPALLVLLAVFAYTAPVAAQATDPGQPGNVVPLVPAEPAMQRNLELSAGAQHLSNGFGNWSDLTLRGAYGLPSHVLQGELSAHRRFNKDGVFLGVSDTYTFNEDWFGSIALGAGDGAFYLPRYRVDATLYRKWLANRNLVSSVGLGHYHAPDGHTDRSVSLGLVYYFEAPWIAEGGVRFNSSDPGAIKTRQQFMALTWGRNKQDLVTARYGWGREGYLAIAANTQLVNFSSREASLTWRHWLNPKTGVLVGANRYTNPFYRRSGVTVGVFHDFD